MTGEASTFGAAAGLDAMTGRATQTSRTTYLCLLSAAPTDATTMATMTEVINGSARQAVTWSTPTGDPSETHNTNVMTFGPFTTDPANVTHCALVSALTGTVGDFIYWWVVTTPRDAAIGDSIQVAASALSASLD